MTDFSNVDVSNQVAAAWERHRKFVFESNRAVSEWVVDRVAPQPGQTILDVCAGPGETGFLAAQRVGPEGRLISTDLGEEMVAAASRGAKAAGLTNVEARVMDAQSLDLADGSADGVVSRYGIMLVPEPMRAVAEVRRVLRPGGRFAYAVWAGPESNPWLTMLAMAVIQAGGTPAGSPFAPGGPFSLPTPEANRELLDGAGFTSVESEVIDGTVEYDSFDEYWDVQSSLAGPLVRVLGEMPAEQYDRVKAAAREACVPYAVGDGDRISIPTRSIVACGTA